MQKKVLKTDKTKIERELQKLETSAKKFQPLLDALIQYEYAPSTKEFHEIVYGRPTKRDNPLDEFLRERTVKKHPAIDTLPISAFMKKVMIELPKECELIMQIYNSLPASSTFLKDVYGMELTGGKVTITEATKQAIIDSYTLYADQQQYEALARASEVLTALQKLEADFGINFFSQNLIQGDSMSSLQGATLKPEQLKIVVSEFRKNNK